MQTALNISKIAMSFVELAASIKKNPSVETLGHAVAAIRAMAAQLEEFAGEMEKQLNEYREAVKG